MQFDRLRRREFIALLCNADDRLLAPVSQNEELVRGLRQGLKQAGFVEGENVATVYRFAENKIDRLPALADDLGRHVHCATGAARDAGGAPWDYP